MVFVRWGGRRRPKQQRGYGTEVRLRTPRHLSLAAIFSTPLENPESCYHHAEADQEKSDRYPVGLETGVVQNSKITSHSFIQEQHSNEQQQRYRHVGKRQDCTVFKILEPHSCRVDHDSPPSGETPNSDAVLSESIDLGDQRL